MTQPAIAVNAHRPDYLPFAKPDIDQSEFAYIRQALDAGWVTTGPRTRQFEADFAAAVGAKHAIAVNSCTAAMHLALDAIGLRAGDEVITSPYTFAATAEVVRYFNAKPVFVDVCPTDLNLDPACLEAAITPRTKAVIPVHIAGVAANLSAIAAIAARHGLAVIEDAAHAFPTTVNGQTIGEPLSVDATNHASRITHHATCFSFYATKTITTGEGGMICTDNDEMAERCRIMALHGISKDAWKRYTAEGSWYYEIIAPGYKYNMTDIAAAMGLAQLAKAERMWQRRTAIAKRYQAAFRDVPALQVPYDPDDALTPCAACRSGCEQHTRSHAWHLYMLRLNLAELTIGRNQFIEELKRRNIGTSVHFIPLHVHPYYRETYGYRPEDFPVAYTEFLREISLPIYSKMSDQDIQDVIDAVLDVVAQHSV